MGAQLIRRESNCGYLQSRDDVVPVLTLLTLAVLPDGPAIAQEGVIAS